MKILGIETAVDETAAAVVEDGCNVCSTVVSSQFEIHKKYGGVVPELAARGHLAKIIPTFDKALQIAKVNLGQIDAIAVSTTPGLVIALLIGLEVAKTLSFIYKKPLVAINDLESHAFANWLEKKDLLENLYQKKSWPILYLIVSGGTTALFLASYFGNFHLIGETLDDAAGEAFDKVAKMLRLPYPGGPAISKTASAGDRKAFLFPRPLMRAQTYNFSFSGLKTAVLYQVRKLQAEKRLTRKLINDIAASFEEAVVETLVKKTLAAAANYKVKAIAVGGGVAANDCLRDMLTEKSPIEVYFPQKKYCTDNAAMLAGVAHFYVQKKIFTPWQELEPFFYKDGEGKLCRS